MFPGNEREERQVCDGYCGFWKQDCITKEGERDYIWKIQHRGSEYVEYEMQIIKEKIFLSRMNKIKGPFVYIPA